MGVDRLGLSMRRRPCVASPGYYRGSHCIRIRRAVDQFRGVLELGSSRVLGAANAFLMRLTNRGACKIFPS